MTIKFVQINIYKGKYLEDLIAFLKKQAPDFVAMQEVSAGSENLTGDGKDLFEIIKNTLGMDGVFKEEYRVTDNPGLLGSAVFSKRKILKSNIVTLKDSVEITSDTVDDPSFFSQTPGHIVDAISNIDGKNVHAMSFHGAWTAPPTDTNETMRQARIISDYLKSLDEPFVVGCDFNAVIQGKTVGIVNEAANNLMLNSGVLETTNPKVHKIAPRGYLIDYIFASSDFKLKRLEVPRITVSDHLPVVAELEIQA